MRRIFICGLPARYTIFVHIFSLTERFLKKVTEHKMCFLIVSTTFSEAFLILRRNERDMIKKCV